MKNGIDTEVYQVFTVVKSVDSYIIRQVFLLNLGYFILQCGYHLFRILAFTHHHYTFYHIAFIVTTNLS